MMHKLLLFISFWIVYSASCASQDDGVCVLEDVVVVGYGTKGPISEGATSKVKTYSSFGSGSFSLTQALAGKLKGVQISVSDGSLDAEARITVRGGGSITQDNSPLYIVDGFPVNSISDIPVTAIKSVEVLKDASAMALYGARGANGVVVVTTDKKRYSTSVEYFSRYGVRRIAKKLKTLSSGDYVRMQYELAQYSSANAERFARKYGLWDDLDIYENVPATDWQEKVFGKTAFFMTQGVDLYFVHDKTRSHVGYTFDTNEGIMVGNEAQRHRVVFDLTSELHKRVSFDLNAAYTNKESKGAGTSSAGSSSTSRLKHSVIYSPVDLNPYGETDAEDEEAYSSLFDPLTVAKDDYKRVEKNELLLNAGLSFKILKDNKLKLRSEAGVLRDDSKTFRAYGVSTSQARQNGALPLASINDREKSKFRMMNYLEYSPSLLDDRCKVRATVGQEFIDERDRFVYNESRYFPKYISPEQALSSMSLGTAQPVSTYEKPADRLLSFFANLKLGFDMNGEYDRKDEYGLTLTFRADRSSKFAQGNQWGYFPAVSIWKNMLDLDIFEMRPRLSYGLSGNNRIADDLYRVVFEAGQTADPSVFFDEERQTFLHSGTVLYNPNLKWETSILRNVGADFRLRNGVIGRNEFFLELDFYKNTTRDLLVQSEIPVVSGYKTMMQNVGETSNCGVEVSTRYVYDTYGYYYDEDGILLDSREGKFRLSFSANVALNRNRVEKLGDIKESLISSGWAGSEISSDYLLKEGEPIGCMYGFVTDGFYGLDDFEYDAENASYKLKDGVPSNAELLASSSYFGPGFVRFKDLNGDGVITEDGDRTVIGKARPKCTGGFGFHFEYAGKWYLKTNFSWSYGNDVYNANKIEFTTSNKYLYRNMTEEMKEGRRWTNVDSDGSVITDPAKLAEMNSGASIWSPYIGRYVFHSWAVEDGSYLRFDNITIGYNFEKFFGGSGSVYFSVDNLWCWTKYSGYDPDVNTRYSTPLTPSVDYSAYPRSRTYTVGFNVKF